MSSKPPAAKTSPQPVSVAWRPKLPAGPSAAKFIDSVRAFPLFPLVGNQAMIGLLDSGRIQAKLRVSQPGDPDELEADRVASQVASGGRSAAPPSIASPAKHSALPPTLHRKCSCSGGAKCAECEMEDGAAIHRKSASASSAAPTVHGAPDNLLHGLGSGRPLDSSVRQSMESKFGRDFSGVRVHDDSQAADSARAIDARAFTSGSHVYFSAGSYAPHSGEGQSLLAHELVHVVQQTGGSGNRGGAASAPRPANGSRAARSAASNRGPAISPQPAGIQRFSFRKLGSEALACAKATGRSITSLVTLDFSSLSDLLGLPQPHGDPASILNTILAAIRHPCLQLVPGYSALVTYISKIESVRNFLKGAWVIIQNPNIVLDPIKQAIGDMVNKIPAEARRLADAAAAKVGAAGKRFIEGIWRHLGPKLNYLAKNWWSVIKETAWTLIWPWPSVGKEFSEIWGHIKSGADNLWNLRISQAVDDLLAVWSGANSVAGLLSGWFTIASVLVGAVLGGIFGVGAGAVPGAAAGLEFAGSVGEGILASTVAAETAKIAKAALDLTEPHLSQARTENAYENISGSGVTLAITGIMVLLGSIATRFAKGLFDRVANLFENPPQVEAPKVQAPKLEAPKVETPKLETPKVEGPKTEVPKTEVPKTEVPKAEPPKTETPKAEPPKTEAPKAETPKSEEPKTEAPEPKTETPKAEPPKTETPNAEPPKTETSEPRTEAPKAETPKTEAPAAEPPKTEAPKTETPKAEPPKTETAKAETPKTETPEPKTPEPKTPEPKTETPKAETPGEKPADSGKGEEPESAKSEEPEKPKKSKSPKDDPQAGVKRRLEHLKKDLANIQENMERVSNEISETNKKVSDLKNETAASSGDARAKSAAELRAAREHLADLNDEYKSWVEDKLKNLKDTDRLIKALKEGTYDRPTFRKGKRDEVWEAAKKNSPDGIVRDPLTKQEIKPGDPWEMGHKPGYEFWKHQQSAAERGISRDQFNDEYNDSKIYRPETPETNASHKLEAPDEVYHGK
jgi:Domain of unknown function (DUF4157)/HNH/ENDO VII superfamily nuclease with conserved GHE residues